MEKKEGEPFGIKDVKIKFIEGKRMSGSSVKTGVKIDNDYIPSETLDFAGEDSLLLSVYCRDEKWDWKKREAGHVRQDQVTKSSLVRT